MHLIGGLIGGIVMSLLTSVVYNYFTPQVSAVQQQANNYTAELDKEAQDITPEYTETFYNTKFGSLAIQNNGRTWGVRINNDQKHLKLDGCYYHMSYLKFVTIGGVAKCKSDFTSEDWSAFQKIFDNYIGEVYRQKEDDFRCHI